MSATEAHTTDWINGIGMADAQVLDEIEARLFSERVRVEDVELEAPFRFFQRALWQRTADVERTERFDVLTVRMITGLLRIVMAPAGTDETKMLVRTRDGRVLFEVVR